MRHLPISFAYVVALVIFGLVGPLACGDDAVLPAENDERPADPSGDANQPAQQANDILAGTEISLTAKVVIDLASTDVPTTSDVEVEAVVGQPLVARFQYLGNHSGWTLAMAGVNTQATAISPSNINGVVVTTSATTFQTAQLSAGTYDLVATFHGEVAGAMTDAVITVHVKLAAASS